MPLNGVPALPIESLRWHSTDKGSGRGMPEGPLPNSRETLNSLTMIIDCTGAGATVVDSRDNVLPSWDPLI